MKPRRDERESQPRLPLLLRIFLCLYALLWLTMIFAAGLNSLWLRRIDYATCGVALGMSAGLYLLLKFLPRFLRR